MDAQIAERARIDREAQYQGIDPRALWTAAHDEAVNLPGDTEAATVEAARRLLNADWRLRE